MPSSLMPSLPQPRSQERAAIANGKPRGLTVWGLVCAACLVFGCSEPGAQHAADEEQAAALPTGDSPSSAKDPSRISVSDLRRKLKANDQAEFIKSGGKIVKANLYKSGIQDLAPLKGLELDMLDISNNPVSKLDPLIGMPLKTLIMEQTRVTDLTPLEGLQLEHLNVKDCKISDITALNGMPLKTLNLNATDITDIETIKSLSLETLWIPATAVTDLTPLAGKKLVSLDIERTSITSLQVLEDMESLRRLNIVDTPITDLTPLSQLRLERLLFSPERIKSGLQAVRSMPSLQTLGTSFEGQMPAAQFWQAFDAGQLPPADSDSPR